MREVGTCRAGTRGEARESWVLGSSSRDQIAKRSETRPPRSPIDVRAIASPASPETGGHRVRDESAISNAGNRDVSMVDDRSSPIEISVDGPRARLIAAAIGPI